MIGMSLHRRTLLAGAAALGALATATPALAEIDPSRAAAFINAAGQELVSIINNPRLDQATRRARVTDVLRRTVDVEGTGRFILGRYWRQATPAQQQEYLRLFEDIILHNLSSRFGEYEGVRFALGRTQQRTEEDVLVSTIIQQPNQQPFSLDWRVSEVNGQPKVVDVIAEGTSLRLTTRSEYSSVIQRGGGDVSALLAAMRNQIQQLARRG